MEQERVLALYDAYADGVYRVALGYLRSAHDAEDAVQAVFCRLLEKELTIWPGRERAFLTKLTINHCKNQLAAAKRFAPEALDELRLPGGAGGPRGASRGDGAAGKVPAGRGAALSGGILVFRDRRAAAADAVRRLHAPAPGAKDVA